MKCRACGYKWQEIEGSPDVTEGFKTISDDVMRFEKIEGNFTMWDGKNGKMVNKSVILSIKGVKIMRKIVEIIAGRQIDLMPEIDLSKIKITGLWTVYDEPLMWDSCKFNPHTGKKVETLEDLYLQHHKGVFIEDKIHDWNVRNNKLDYYSRVAEQGGATKILVEYEWL